MSNQSKLTVYIVDDDKMYNNALKHYLETECNDIDLHIDQFIVGETLFLSIEKKPHVVILDYHLNSKYYDAVNGVKVLQEIKRASPESKVIMVSGQENVDVAIETINEGAMDYIVKNKDTYEKIKKHLYKIHEERADFFKKVKHLFKK